MEPSPQPSAPGSSKRAPDNNRSYSDHNSFHAPINKSNPDIETEQDGSNEQSPLLAARTSAEIESPWSLRSVLSPTGSDPNFLPDADSHEDSRQETKSSWYLFLLTLAMSGLSIAWSVELSNGSPYLLSLGISKSLLAFVWIAGPLSGALVQPYVGIRSDRCRSRFGKRRPFMIGGAIVTITSLMALGWARELVAGFLGIFGASPDSRGVSVSAIVFAVLMIYVLDFAINAVQAATRAFIVDNAPTHQQDSANAWAMRLAGIGHIVGYLFGYIDLPHYFWFLGDTEFKILCILGSIAFISTTSISCLSIQERDPRLEGPPPSHKGGVFPFVIDLYRSFRGLPPQIVRVCQVQFFAWVGWFPFLFYITTYVGGIYADPYFAANPNMTDAEVDEIWERGTRRGTFALFIFAITTSTTSVLLPFVVAESYRIPERTIRTPMTVEGVSPLTQPKPGRARTNDYFAHHDAQSISGSSPTSSTRLSAFLRRLPSLRIASLTLRRTWMLSHLFFALLMWLTLFVHTTTGATILVALIGIPWAITNWAPFALIAAEISKRDNIRRALRHSRGSRGVDDQDVLDEDSEGGDQAGVVLGIHNVFITVPQIVATLVSSAVFNALQKPRGSVGDDSVAWVLRLGGVTALVAAWFTMRVKDERT